METKIQVHEPVKSDAKRLPQIKEAMQRHHDFYLNLKPDEIKKGDEDQIALAKQREEQGEVSPIAPTEPQA